jgi:hypothetical protein
MPEGLDRYDRIGTLIPVWLSRQSLQSCLSLRLSTHWRTKFPWKLQYDQLFLVGANSHIYVWDRHKHTSEANDSCCTITFTAYGTATFCPALLKSPFITEHNGREEGTFRWLRGCGNGAPGSPEVKGELPEQDPSVRLMVFIVPSADSLVGYGPGGGFDAGFSWLFQH